MSYNLLNSKFGENQYFAQGPRYLQTGNVFYWAGQYSWNTTQSLVL